MTRYTLTLLDEHYQRLRTLLFRDSLEYGALLLCGRSKQVDPWTGQLEERLLVLEVVDVGDAAFFDRSATGMTWSTTPLLALAKRAMARDYAVCVVHSHPNGSPVFSERDDEADREAFGIVFGRMETARPHVSIVMDSEGGLAARAYGPDLVPHPVELVRVLGNRLSLRYPGRGHGISRQEFDRQARTFGARAIEDLAHLRVGIVGCGGTGSAVASLLARLGTSRLVLIDADTVDETNLSRLHFSCRQDAILGRPKVTVLAEEIARIGLVQSVVQIPRAVDDPKCRDALRSCDVVFGCTDDHLGRNVLNRLAHFYLIPVVDLGLLIEPRDAGGYDTFDGRVTVVQPGYPCQVCRHLIDPNIMHEESLRRNDPHLLEAYRRAGYVRGLPDPSPVVVTFTTEVAAMAVNELLHRLTGFRGDTGHCAERVRRFDEVKDADSVPSGRSDPNCKLCARRSYDGRGDMDPFLDSA